VEQILDVQAWREVIVQSLASLGNTIAAFLPTLVATIVILGVGWLAAKLVEVVASRSLRQIGLDRASARLGIADTLGEAQLEMPLSCIVGRLLFWIVMLTFVLAAAQTLGLSAVTAALDRLVSYLPNVVAAALIVVLGLLLARFVRSAAHSAAATAGLPGARFGAVAHAGVVLIVGAVALEQIGIDTALVLTALTGLLAGVGVMLGISLALGARPVVTHILAGHFLRQTLPREARIDVRGKQGTVERVGPIDTLLRDGERSWSIPNAQLMEEIVGR
jgi:hypothetical protein